MFSFNFECQQGVDIGLNLERLRKKDISLMYFVVIADSEELNMMLTIFQTCAKFQNKLIDEFISMQDADACIAEVPLALAQPADFFSLESDFLDKLVDLYAFNDPTFNNGHRVNFNFKRIEDIVKSKLAVHCKRLLYERENLDPYPAKGQTGEIGRLLTDLKTVVKASELSVDSVAKLDSYSMESIRQLENEVAKVLFYILRSGIRNPHQELKKFCSANGIELSQELTDLNLDFGMIHDLYRQIQLKLSVWKFNNQISHIYKDRLTPEERADLRRFKKVLGPVMLELLTKSLRLYINQKCTQNSFSILPLNLFEFMGYTEIGLVDIECASCSKVTISMLESRERSQTANEEKPEPVTYTFERILTHNKIFEILQLLES